MEALVMTVTRDDVEDCIMRSERPMSMKEIAKDMGLPWNENTRKSVSKRVQSGCKFGIYIKIQNGKEILITIRKEEETDRKELVP
jgi:hypothetical protein